MRSCALVGASGRALYLLREPIRVRLSDNVRFVGIFDPNLRRAEKLREMAGLSCDCYSDCDEMLAKASPDMAIISVMDRYHHQFTVKCLAAGVDVVTEKPMTIDEAKCLTILDAEKQFGRKIGIMFNCRFAPYAVAVKQAMVDGLVGEMLNVHFEYMLDTIHGADYFRRWHRRKENSGGLLVHKSTHHFDLVNWWIEDEPVEVMAYGTRRFYGPTRKARGERCLTCDHKKTCEFYFDIIAEELNKGLYADCEDADGYYRDRCVFADDIDIEDTMALNVRYSRGALMTYSLIAHSPYEGYKISINGTKGRLEAAEYLSGHRAGEPNYCFDLYDRVGRKVSYAIPKAAGGHGGGDERMLRMLFEPGLPDPLRQLAGSLDGAKSILIGIAANISIAEHRNVRIDSLVSLGEDDDTSCSNSLTNEGGGERQIVSVTT